MYLNEIMIAGFLGSDPEIRYLNEETAVARFAVATNEFYTDKDGEKQSITTWHDCLFYGNTAEKFIKPFVKKGDNIFVRGKLRKRIFTDQDGQSRLAVEIIGSEIQIIKSAAEKTQNPIDAPDAPTDDNPLMTN